MSIACWVLVYEVVGLAVVAAVFRKDLSEFFEGLLVVALWPLLPLTFAAARYNRAKRERARQASITAQVAAGVYTPKQAYAMKWKGPKK